MPSPRVEWVTNRRDFLTKAGLGFGALALSALLAEEGFDSSARAEVPEIDPLRPLAPGRRISS
jgi:hypothetical protein